MPTTFPCKTRPRCFRFILTIPRACFAGTRIVLRQVSAESEHIYDFIVTLHKHCKGDYSAVAKEAGLSQEETHAYLNYAAQFLGNLGNYKSFGDSKFVPRLEPRQLKALATVSKDTLGLYEKFKDAIYAGDDVGKLHLGYPGAGHVSTYYPDSPSITKEEIAGVSDFLEGKGLLPENTRISKTSDGFAVLIASASSDPSSEERDLKDSEWTLDDGNKVKLVFGDYSKEMDTIAHHIQEAKKHAANDNEREMMEEYSKSFRTGSLQAFKRSQKAWVLDKGPQVESDIGFIETYRDPHGIRGEWEGFVAMVNKERTQAFGKLVETAPQYIPLLPWDKSFEKDKFLSPDFTSLEVLTFAGSGIPAGINIPNYDDIRQNFGFKNVSLGNILSAKAPNEQIPFIKDSDVATYQKYRDPAFEVQVGLHELLGHGCGKLLQETEPGKYNFDFDNKPVSPLSGKPISTWYKPGQTWGSVFGPIAASYEECRAECVAMALSCEFPILALFGFGDGKVDMHSEAGDVLFTAYLQMARAGIAALEFWDPKSRKWGQAHMQARFSILRTFLNAGVEFCQLEWEKDDLSDLTIRLERDRILDLGRPAVDDYLQKLHIYKATADYAAAKRLYDDVTDVEPFYENMVRPAVLKKKTPRKVFVQANTLEKDGKVELMEYEATNVGMIQSYADRKYV
jgi:dipeptidyl-peptidase-3